MDDLESNVSQSETANIKLSGRDWKLSMTVSVPRESISVHDLLPMVQFLADKVVDHASKAVEQHGQKISCQKACGACCRQLVPISASEARHIRNHVKALSEPRQSEVRARFADARRHLKESGLLEKVLQREHWRNDEVQSIGLKYFLQGIPCPFLEQESCSIYLDRPITCREYLVTSPAQNCAQPNKDNIDQVQLPIKTWPALARFDKQALGARFIRWVPLILALDETGPEIVEPPPRPGPELLYEFVDHLVARQERPNEYA